METNSLIPTTNGQLPHANKGGRRTIALRLDKSDHKELKDQAHSETRSMSFVALRRYLKGRELELNETN